MLGVKTYSQDYVDTCRRRVATQLDAYRAVAATGDAAALAAFEPVFFDNMVLVLDSYFTHRLRTVEGKDGNPLNEVRVLCTSLLEHGGTLTADKAIKLKARDQRPRPAARRPDRPRRDRLRQARRRLLRRDREPVRLGRVLRIMAHASPAR